MLPNGAFGNIFSSCRRINIPITRRFLNISKLGSAENVTVPLGEVSHNHLKKSVMEKVKIDLCL